MTIFVAEINGKGIAAFSAETELAAEDFAMSSL